MLAAHIESGLKTMLRERFLERDLPIEKPITIREKIRLRYRMRILLTPAFIRNDVGERWKNAGHSSIFHQHHFV